jgi:hypothetical protein
MWLMNNCTVNNRLGDKSAKLTVSLLAELTHPKDNIIGGDGLPAEEILQGRNIVCIAGVNLSRAPDEVGEGFNFYQYLRQKNDERRAIA